MSMEKTSTSVPTRIIVFLLTYDVRGHDYLIFRPIFRSLWKEHYTGKFDPLHWSGNHLSALLAIFIP